MIIVIIIIIIIVIISIIIELCLMVIIGPSTQSKSNCQFWYIINIY